VKLHNKLSAYLDQVEQVVTELPVYVEKYTEEVLTPDRVNLRLRLRFDNGNLLEFNEAVVVENDELMTLGYRYHYQNSMNQLIFRYDDTPHFPELSTFPHHKHTTSDVVEHCKPQLIDVLQEANGIR